MYILQGMQDEHFMSVSYQVLEVEYWLEGSWRQVLSGPASVKSEPCTGYTQDTH